MDKVMNRELDELDAAINAIIAERDALLRDKAELVKVMEIAEQHIAYSREVSAQSILLETIAKHGGAK